MEGSYILAIDQGTTSSRVVLFDKQGVFLDAEQMEFTQHFPFPGWVEHDAEEIWRTVETCMNGLLSRHQGKKISCTGITNQRETTVVWDKRTGKPVYNAIVWQSRQTAEICQDWKYTGFETEVREKTGLVIDAYFSASKVRWILDNVKGTRELAEQGHLLFGTIDTWLIWKMTKGKVHATDYSNASRTLIFNIHQACWDEALMNQFKIPVSMAPEVRSSSGDFGVWETSQYSIPVTGVAGDQQAALFGQCCFDAGMAKNTYGTGCFMLMNTGNKAIHSNYGLLTTIGWQLNGEITYALEGSIFVAGSAIQWLRDGLQLIRSSAEANAVEYNHQDNEGVYFVPAFVGLGTPYWDSDARGAIFGLTRGTKKHQLIRAALEAMAYQTREVLDAMHQDSGITLKTLKVDGGATENNFLMQFQADILKKAVERPENKESTALGAAFLAGIGCGIWKMQDLPKLRKIEKEFKPELDEKHVESLFAGWKRAVNACRKFSNP